MAKEMMDKQGNALVSCNRSPRLPLPRLQSLNNGLVFDFQAQKKTMKSEEQTPERWPRRPSFEVSDPSRPA